ncbi:MAG: helix-turn-helix domain-containing protein [Fibrobacterota bacterium]|nr:helix-turn-helix domain-containing protein [Fibrobacterota bacterium]QQS04056.1 MAG: helix-turn-helix domain-containing protein [Fibrobacterota bacterium]
MSDEKPSAAQMLRQARLEHDWTLEQVSNQTRIPKEQIQALEECAWDVLPGAPYARAFCKTLAQAYELDADMVLVGLRNDMGLAPATEGKSGKSQLPIGVATASEEGARNRAPLIMAGLILLAFLLVLAATRLGGVDSFLHSPADTLKPPVDSMLDTSLPDSIGMPRPSPVRKPAAASVTAPDAPKSPIAHLSAVDTGNAVFVLYIRQGINKVRKKTLGLGDTLSFNPDTALFVHSVSHRPLTLRGSIRKDSIDVSCFRVDRQSDSVRFSMVSEDEWQKMAGSIKRLKRKTSEE